METIVAFADQVREAVVSSAFVEPLSRERLQERSPAVFATRAHERTGSGYRFISTQRVLSALEGAGFFPVGVRQSRTRTASPEHARHVVRLRRRFETVQLREAVPEIVLLNSHDGRSAYQLYFGLYRAVCTNGMVFSTGKFASFRVAHRGEELDQVVNAALTMCERFDEVGHLVEQMEAKALTAQERLSFAQDALALRYPKQPDCMAPSLLLACRRIEDVGEDLWRTLNVVQENLLRGGVPRRSTSGRLGRTRRVTSISEDLRINSGVWSLAAQRLAA